MMQAKYAGKCPRCGTKYQIGTLIYSDAKKWIPVDCQGCAKRKTDLNYLLQEGLLGPNTQDDCYMEITCVNEYEAPGCHDTWGFRWMLTLPNIPSHWRSTTGWQPHNAKFKMSFTGGSLEQVVEKATEFLQWWRQPQDGAE